MHKKYAELAVYSVAIIAIFAIFALPGGKISGEVIGHELSSDTILGSSNVEVKNTDDFTWNNVIVILKDQYGFEYTCPKMLYLKPGATATIDTDYCFSKANEEISNEPVSLVIITDEGSASFLY